MKQVNRSHYEFNRYVTKERWASMWYQLNELNKLAPENILEIGPGPGIFKATLNALDIAIETLDIDPDLSPDHVASALAMPFEDGHFDVACAFQMLEHLPWEQSLKAFSELNRVSRKAIIISVPDAKKCWPMAFYVPRKGLRWIHLPRPTLRLPKHKFDGQHYWEVNKTGFSTRFIINNLQKLTLKKLSHTFRVPENPYHRFFVWKTDL